MSEPFKEFWVSMEMTEKEVIKRIEDANKNLVSALNTQQINREAFKGLRRGDLMTLALANVGIGRYLTNE